MNGYLSTQKVCKFYCNYLLLEFKDREKTLFHVQQKADITKQMILLNKQSFIVKIIKKN